MRSVQAPEILLILLVLVLLFGAKKLPDLSRSIGRSLRIFKSEIKDLKDDDRDAPPVSRPREVEGRVIDDASTSHKGDVPGDASRVPDAEHDH